MRPAAGLSARIRGCLNPGNAATVLGGDFAVAGLPREDRALRPAAVLVPLIEHRDGLTVLLTQRTDHLEHHPGQVSFPGGGTEEGDAGPEATALRESEEEIGLGPEWVEVVGHLDLYQTVTGFLVTPVVGLVRPGFTITPDPFEVADVFEVPLSYVLDTRNHLRQRREIGGRVREYYVLPYQGRNIWGATAAMLVNLAAKLRPLHA